MSTQKHCDMRLDRVKVCDAVCEDDGTVIIETQSVKGPIWDFKAEFLVSAMEITAAGERIKRDICRACAELALRKALGMDEDNLDRRLERGKECLRQLADELSQERVAEAERERQAQDEEDVEVAEARHSEWACAEEGCKKRALPESSFCADHRPSL